MVRTWRRAIGDVRLPETKDRVKLMLAPSFENAFSAQRSSYEGERVCPLLQITSSFRLVLVVDLFLRLDLALDAGR